MKRSCLIVLELAILWSQVFSSEMEESGIKPKDPSEYHDWMVTVLLPNGRSYDKAVTEGKPEPLKKAYEEILCAGVIVHERYIYVPGFAVENLKPTDLKIFHSLTKSEYTVRDIAFNRPRWGQHALLILSEKIENAAILPIIGPWEVANVDSCIASEFWSEAMPNSLGVSKIPRRGTFSPLRNNKCWDNGAFVRPYGDDVDPKRILGYPVEVEHGITIQPNYLSPLVCRTWGRKSLVLVGYYAWAFSWDDDSVYFGCATDGQTVDKLMYTLEYHHPIP